MAVRDLRVVAAILAATVLLSACAAPVGPGANGTQAPASDAQVGNPHGSSAGGSSGQAGASGQSGMPGATGTASGSNSASATTSAGTGVRYTVPRAVHEAAWLCQTPVSVDDATAAGTDGLQCKVELSFTDTAVTVKSTGIPNHDYASGGGCCTTVQDMSNTFPLQPEMAKTVTYAPTRGSIATAVNGVQVFGPEDADSQDVVIATYSSPTTQPRLEMCDGHSAPQGGIYHYHADGNCMHWHAGAGQTWSDYDFSKVDSTTHSKIVAFAPDGFPIYGTYGYDASDNSTIQEITSSYRLKDGKTGSGGIADQEYVAGMGDLDECNGRFGPTPEFPDGIYHYYSTKHNGEGGWGFPYFPLCYKGVVTSSGGMAGGAGGGMGGGGSSMSGSSGPPPGGSMSGSQSSPPPSGGGGSGGTSSCPPPPSPGQPPPSTPPPSGCPPPPH